MRWLAHISRALSDLEAEMNACGYAAEEVYAVLIALDEAILNAVKHGRGGDPSKCVRVRHRVTPEEVTAEILDEASALDAGRMPDPCPEKIPEKSGGRGVCLSCTRMTWVHSGDRGQEATMCKCSTPKPASRRR